MTLSAESTIPRQKRYYDRRKKGLIVVEFEFDGEALAFLLSQVVPQAGRLYEVEDRKGLGEGVRSLLMDLLLRVSDGRSGS